jgi:hypothetical protein
MDYFHLRQYFNSQNAKCVSVRLSPSEGSIECVRGQDKSKAIPTQAWTGSGLQEVEAPKIFRQSAHECGKIVRTTHRPPLPTSRYSWYSFL